MIWWVVFSPQAAADAAHVAAAGLKPRVLELLALLGRDPLAVSPPFATLQGDLSGAYSRRLDLRQQLVYEVLREERVVRVLSLWTHHD